MDFYTFTPILNGAVARANKFIEENPSYKGSEYAAAWGAIAYSAQWLADDAKKLAEEALKDDPNPITMASLAREVIRRINSMESKTL